MEKIIGAIACGLAALDCLGKALGVVPQSLMSEAGLWVWYIAMVGWICNGVLLLKR